MLSRLEKRVPYSACLKTNSLTERFVGNFKMLIKIGLNSYFVNCHKNSQLITFDGVWLALRQIADAFVSVGPFQNV